MSGSETNKDYCIETLQARIDLLAEVNDAEPIQLKEDPDAKGEILLTDELGDFMIKNGGCFNWLMIGCEKLLLKSHSKAVKQTRKFSNITRDFDGAELKMLELAMAAVVECGMPFEQAMEKFKASVTEYREKAGQCAMEAEGEAK